MVRALVVVTASHWGARARATMPHSITVAQIATAGKGQCVADIKRWCIQVV